MITNKAQFFGQVIKIREGLSLSQANGPQGADIFPLLLIASIAAIERNGKLLELLKTILVMTNRFHYCVGKCMRRLYFLDS